MLKSFYVPPKPKVYTFSEQFDKGSQGERELDTFFTEQDFEVEVITALEVQKIGIDRVFRRGGKTWTVEYKTDYAAIITGNAFLEMIVDNRVGWVLSTQANYVYYYVPRPVSIVYVVDSIKLRGELNTLVSRLTWKTIVNVKYSAHGMLYPLDELEKISTYTYEIGT